MNPAARLSLLPAALFFSLLTVFSASGQTTLGKYSFTGANTCANAAAAGVVDAGAHPNLTFSDFSSGPGVTCTMSPYGGVDTYSQSGFDSPNLDTDDYLEFSVTPQSGFSMTLTNLLFTHRRGTVGPASWALRSSLDGFANDLSVGSSNTTDININYPMSGATFSNLTAALTFRFYVWGATNAGGPWRIDNVELRGTVNSACAVSATVSHTDITTGCFGSAGGSITVSNPTGASSYEYSIDGGQNWQASGSFTGLTGGAYNVQIRDAANTSCVTILNTAVVITQPSQLNAVVNGVDLQCPNGSDGRIGIQSASGGGGTYEYSIDGGLNWQSNTLFVNLSAGSYDVRIRDAALPTCERTLNSALVLSQPDAFQATVSATQPTCANPLGTITITNPSGGTTVGSYLYSINNGVGWQLSGTFANLAAGSYDVWMSETISATCSGVIATNVLIDASAALSASVSSANVPCGGGLGRLSINASSGGSGSYEYSVDGGVNWQSDSTFAVAAGSYDVYMRDAQDIACTRQLDAAQVIGQDTAVGAPSVQNGSVCGSGSARLEATSASGGSFAWYADSTSATVLDTNAVFFTPVINTDTDYFVAVTAGGCTSPRVRVSATIAVIPLAGFVASSTSVTTADTVQFDFTGPVGSSFVWQIDGNTFSTAQNPTHRFSAAGSFAVTVTVTSPNGCSATSDPTVITVANPSTVQALSASAPLSAYPNPSQGLLTLSAPALGGQAVVIQVLDMYGRAVFTQHEAAFAGSVALTLTDLPVGCYFVQLACGGQVVGQKLLIR